MPADCNDRIVKLQLARAAQKVATGGTESGATAFHRIVWAPKVLEEGTTAGDAPEREPVKVLAAFDEIIGGDKVEGDTSSRFIDFLKDHLKRTLPVHKGPVLQGHRGG